MKKKKIFTAFFMMTIFAAFSFAETAISFGPAFTNYFVRTKLEGEKTADAVKAILGQASGNIKDEKNNAAGFAVDITGSFLYAAFQLAFPQKTHSSIFKGGKESLKGSSMIFDSQLGAGYTFFKNNPFRIFLGGGIGINAVYANQKLTVPVLGEVNYGKADIMFGVGANLLLSFYFTKNIGIYGGIADTVYFVPLKTQKKFKIKGKEYSLDQGQNSSAKVVNNWANSLNIKAGLSIKF